MKKHVVRNSDINTARRQKRKGERKFKKLKSSQSKHELNAAKKFLSYTVNKSSTMKQSLNNMNVIPNKLLD